MTFQTRACAVADAGGLVHLLSDLGYPAGQTTVAQRLTRLLDRSDYQLVIAEVGDRLVGVGAVHVFPALHTDAPVALITALVVAEDARGQGVGRALVARLEEFAADAGVGRMLVTTGNPRHDAHTFYERVGFAFTGRRYVKNVPPAEVP